MNYSILYLLRLYPLRRGILPLAIGSIFASEALAQTNGSITIEERPVLGEQATAKITVNLTDVAASDGPLYVSVQSKDDFLSENGAAGGIYKITQSGDYTYEYAVEPGTYAVSVWHDLDNDQKFSMGFMFRPKDGVGTSGKINKMGPPRFSMSKFEAVPGVNVIDVPVYYPSGVPESN